VTFFTFTEATLSFGEDTPSRQFVNRGTRGHQVVSLDGHASRTSGSLLRKNFGGTS
jgi:hypothetical protein